MGNSLAVESNALQVLDQVGASVARAIEMMSEMSDESLWSLRMTAQDIGRAAWRIECAADAEILSRVDRVGGRGKQNSEIATIAEERGVDPRTMRRNAQVHQTFFAQQNPDNVVRVFEAETVLQDKSFFVLALGSDDPHATLNEFARLKTENKDFSTRDAGRYVEREGSPDLDDAIHIALQNDQSRAAWDEFQRAARGLAMTVPVVRGLLNGYIDEIRYEISRPEGTFRERILGLVRDGFNSIDHLASMLNIRTEHCKVLVSRLVDSGDLREEAQERVSGARGAAQKLYFQNNPQSRL